MRSMKIRNYLKWGMLHAHEIYLISVDEDEKDGAMDESGTTATGGGGGRGSSRTGGTAGMAGIPRANRDAMHIAQTLFPSTLCTAFVEVIGLLDDHAVSLDGTAVYEVAYNVSCVVNQNLNRDFK